MKNIKQYYKELGKLVYAVAIADGVIQDDERDKLHEFVLKELAGKESSTDSSGMNQAFYVDFEFDEAEQKKLSVNEVIRSYSSFVGSNHEPNDKELIKNSIRLLETVALAYSKKKEKEILESVEREISAISKSLLTEI